MVNKMSVIDITAKNFEDEVLKSDIPVIVDVWAEWCGPCRMFSPIIDEVSEDYNGKAKFAKLNADNNEEIAAKYNIMSIPTVLLIEKGKVKAMSVGAVPKEAFKKWLDKNM
ncbi:MAG: thioredoxin [Candidatus Marsarchaeota archaeon]|nr:thioredoxin [Candidatus Marsarchaeota archaeon]